MGGRDQNGGAQPGDFGTPTRLPWQKSQTNIGTLAERVADDPARPGIHYDCGLDEARVDRDVGHIRDPEPVRAVRHHVFGKIKEDRQLTPAAHGGHKPAAQPRLKIALSHQPVDLLVIDGPPLPGDHYRHPPPAIGFDLVLNGVHRLNERGIVDGLAWGVIERGA